MILHSCRDCEHWPACPYQQADQCPKLRAELKGVAKPRHKREQPFGQLNGFAEEDGVRPVATRLEDARAAGPESVRAFAVRALKREGLSLREIEDLCRSGWSHETVRKV